MYLFGITKWNVKAENFSQFLEKKCEHVQICLQHKSKQSENSQNILKQRFSFDTKRDQRKDLDKLNIY